MRIKMGILGMILIFGIVYIYLALPDSIPKINKLLFQPSDKHYIGTYVKEREPTPDSIFHLLMVINPDGTGTSYDTTFSLRHVGNFDWENHYDDEYSYITCTWSIDEIAPEEPIEIKNYIINNRLNQQTFSLSGIGKFQEFPYGDLLTPYNSPDGTPIMAKIGYKISDDHLVSNNRIRKSR